VRIVAQALVGRRDADQAERFAAAIESAARETSPWARTASIICVSMRSTGFNVIIGSWKIIAMRLPRSLRHAGSSSEVMSTPFSAMRPR